MVQRRNVVPSSPTGHNWVGFSLFVPLGRPTAVKPKMLKVLGEPSESERELDELTHLPYRNWCEHSVQSTGRQKHAAKKNCRQPVNQIDFSNLATESDLPKRTIVNAMDAQTDYSMAVVLLAKGSTEKYAVVERRRFCVRHW